MVWQTEGTVGGKTPGYQNLKDTQSEGNVDQHLLIRILCIHGETHICPTAKVDLEIQVQRAQQYVSMVKDLPWLIILGKDWMGFSALMLQEVEQCRTGRIQGQLEKEIRGLEAGVRMAKKG